MPVEEVDIFAGEARTDDFLRDKNPAGRIPVLEVEPGRFLPESNAILCFLAEGTAFLPEDRFERAQILQWLFFEQNLLEPGIGTVRFWRLTGREPQRAEATRLKVEQGVEALSTLERHLRTRRFLAGERYTLADIALYAYTHVAPQGGFDLQPFPAVQAWLERVRSQPKHLGELPPYTAKAFLGARGGRPPAAERAPQM